MKAGLIFTGTGPILILTTYPSLDDPKFVEKLEVKGIRKFIAFELPLDDVRRKYGIHYPVILNDIKQTDDLRILDFNGHAVLYNFPLKTLTGPIYHEPEERLSLTPEQLDLHPG